MLKFLNKPYPFNDDLRHNAKIIFFISLGVLVFLLIFQPIEINSFSKKEIFYLVTGIAASTFLVLSLNLIVLPSLFPKIFNVWNIKREIIWNIWILLAISSIDFLFYSKLFGVIDITFFDIGKIVLLGLLPVAVLITINQERLLRSHLKYAQQLNKKVIESKQQKEKLIHFESDYKKDNLIIKSDSLILIKSADNYIEVYYESEDIVKKQMIRSSLKKAEETIRDFDFIIKCHRTFIVNINHIKEIQGNSQGYKLDFKNLDSPALVSQKYIKDFNKII
ncbi:MAG: LytTR family transcriptional regulator [Bacteroidales bacterium]|nr:LytTR family transcriptional regulator [Bacteroidales bacterium]